MKVCHLLPLIAVINAAAISISSEPDASTTDSAVETGSAWWTTLTPSSTLGSDASATTSLPGSYALSIRTISAASASASVSGVAKRDNVNQISDGQIQEQTSTTQTTAAAESVVNQISDGQIQAQTTQAAESVVNQISDGQVQQQTTQAAVSVVNQISDGQVQQQTVADVVNQIGDGQVQQQTVADVVNQIGDGQVQQQTAADVVNQIGDGQVQQQTAAAVNQITDGQVQQQTASAANQISDGQVQATGTAAAADQVSDGQIQATGTSEASSGESDVVSTCVASDSLFLQLKDGVLTDLKGRIGSIVANRQFQFDGPPPQAGAIYAAGWSVVPLDYEEDSETKEEADSDLKDKRDEYYKLALGSQTTFYKCLSGSFYNLYDESIGSQCSEVEFVIFEAVEC